MSEMIVSVYVGYRDVVPDEPLYMDRVLDLMIDAMVAALHEIDPEIAATDLLQMRHPIARELVAARQQNHEVHGGGTPDILREFMPSQPVPEDIARLRRRIDDVLVAAQRQLGSS